MTDFVTYTDDTIVGTDGEDRLTVYRDSGVLWLYDLTPNAVSGYDGHFSNGYAGEGVYFTGIEHFTFIDRAGADNYIATGAGDDVLRGGDGNDTLLVGSGDDAADGGDGMDSFGADLSAWTSAATINLNVISTLISGTVRNMEGFEALTTGSGDDVITGHRSSYMADTIDTGAGNDLVKLWWKGEHDVVAGGAGNDRLQVRAQDAVFLIDLTADAAGGYSGHFSNGYTGEGVYFSGIEHFTFADDFGADNTIITGAGDDLLYGGDGDDVLNCGSGDDTVNGGDGLDSFGADLSGWSSAATINLNLVSTLINGTVRNMEGFESLTTGSGDDVITGHKTSYMADTIDTGAGNDLVKLWWKGEHDVVAGGAGADVLQVTADKGVFLIDLTADVAGGYSGHFSTAYTGEGVYFSGVEAFVFTDRARADNTITTGIGNDVLNGGGGRDTLNGGGGDDILSGGLLRDVLIGSAGRDQIDGGGGNDVLRGGRGADVLTGGIGNDRLSGGTLADRFVFGQGDGADTILDFGDGADRIVIEDGAESFGDVIVEDAGADTIVRFADVSITLLNVDHLTVDAGDFLFL